MSQPQSTTPKKEKDTTEAINQAKPAPAFINESQQHQSLRGRLVRQQMTGQQVGNYVSPSDNILSPASAKLNAYKQSRIANIKTKPRTLFAKTTTMNINDKDTAKAGQ